MTVPPNASEEEMAYAEKWRYVIQLRFAQFGFKFEILLSSQSSRCFVVLDENVLGRFS